MHDYPIEYAIAFLRLDKMSQFSIYSQLPSQGNYIWGEHESENINPGEILLTACLRAIDNRMYCSDDPDFEIANEIACVLEMALTIGHHIIDYHFCLSDENKAVTGPFDGIWDILRRLSRLCNSTAENNIKNIIAFDFLKSVDITLCK